MLAEIILLMCLMTFCNSVLRDPDVLADQQLLCLLKDILMCLLVCYSCCI
jgi:hypothetical protein